MKKITKTLLLATMLSTTINAGVYSETIKGLGSLLGVDIGLDIIKEGGVWVFKKFTDEVEANRLKAENNATQAQINYAIKLRLDSYNNPQMLTQGI